MNEAKHGSVGDAPRSIMNVRKILLVDDEDDIRTIARIALVDIGGVEAVVASSGKEALQLAITERPDLVLLDVMMPGLDGPSTLALLRAEPATADIPVVFLTAKVQRDEVARFRALGARGVIAKPFDPMTLLDDVLRALDESGSRT